MSVSPLSSHGAAQITCCPGRCLMTTARCCPALDRSRWRHSPACSIGSPALWLWLADSAQHLTNTAHMSSGNSLNSRMKKESVLLFKQLRGCFLIMTQIVAADSGPSSCVCMLVVRYGGNQRQPGALSWQSQAPDTNPPCYKSPATAKTCSFIFSSHTCFVNTLLVLADMPAMLC